MIRILVKHCIYEICLEVIFTNAHANFQKPITEKEKVMGGLVAAILARARLITDKTQQGNTNFIAGHIDRGIIKSMKEETKNDINTR